MTKKNKDKKIELRKFGVSDIDEILDTVENISNGGEEGYDALSVCHGMLKAYVRLGMITKNLAKGIYSTAEDLAKEIEDNFDSSIRPSKVKY